ncbi:MAG: Gfo/Idh/MocA family oxidoreductase [Bacteroidales bacterium]|nr:Gfo/Idh/MocA family oxidoreductase [Bacteroidales bacterium]
MEGQSHVLQLKCDPIPTVRIGFIGLGMRGKGAVTRMMAIEGVEIKALCDLEQNNLDIVQKNIIDHQRDTAMEFTGNTGWQELCHREDIDLIYICTDWYSHTDIAEYAMEKGKHVAIEVPAAISVEECWRLVNTAEKTRMHCMMLENCCYDRFELATLNMAQQGIFGEIVHVEGAYLHDLREINANPRISETQRYEPGIGTITQDEPGIIGYHKQWRQQYNIDHTGNPYPTHGLGPVCQVLNIHRGDKMNVLVSLSSNEFGISEYVEERFGKDSPESKQEYKMGDVSTSIIKTEKGKTIVVEHAASTPRPYSRIHQIAGTKGFAQKYPVNQILLPSLSRWALPKEKVDSLLLEYKHPFYKESEEQAEELRMIAHGGMDYIMDYRLIYCLRNGLPLDMDVYDAAEWSCIAELSEISTKNNGAPVEVPDFTRGAWNELPGLIFAK